MKALVLGGGLAGLFAAWRLQREGASLEVWEAGPEAGGWARTLDWPDPEGRPGRLERGPLAVALRRGGALARMLDDLGLEVQCPPPRACRWLGLPGGRFPRPDHLGALLAFPGIPLTERWAWLGEPFRGPGPDLETLQAFFARRLGPEFAHCLLPALVNGLLAAAPQELDRDALPRLRALDLRGGLLRGVLREGIAHRRILPEGMGQLARVLGRALPLRAGKRATALEAGQGVWRVRDASGGWSEAEFVVLALPPRAAAPLLRPLAPLLASRMEACKSRGLRLLHTRHPPTPALPDGFSILMDPAAGGVFLGAVGLIPGDPRGSGDWFQVRSCLAEGAPVEAGLQALRTWVPELGPAIQLRVEEAPAAFPLWPPGSPVLREEILALLPPGLSWTGAWRRGPGLDDLEAELIGS